MLGAEKQRDDILEYVTLNGFINNVERDKSSTSYQFPQLMCAIQTACKTISITLKKCGLAQMQGLGLDKYVKITEMKKMERYFNELFINLVANSYTACLIACKDSDDIIKVDSERAGKYIVVFSASDASLNVDASLCIGTTFAVFRKKGTSRVEEKDVLQPGHKMLAGGYCLYGVATVMVIAFEGGNVSGFTLDNSVGEFMLTEENLRIPKTGKCYSTNEGYSHSWDPLIVEYLEKKKTTKTSTPWSARYLGSLIGDVHRTIKFGGIYMYPASKENPNGKYRLIYECNPLAFVVIQAGGIASNGKISIIDIMPEKIHEKVPFFCGSSEDVDDLLKTLSVER